MNEKNREGLKVLFFYIGTGIALLFAVVSGIRTLFGIINHLVISDSIGWYQLYNSTEMPVNAAFLLVSFIVLVVVTQKNRGTAHEHQDTIWYTLCRVIIYIILTVAVAMTAVAVSILFGDLFSGDISLNNSLKTIGVASVGLMVFYYYRGVLQGVWRAQKKQEKQFVVITSVLVGLVVVSAVAIVNPLEQPALQRTYDKLSCIESVDNTLREVYADEKKGALPTTELYADFLENEMRPYHHFREPECANADITYELLDKTHYRLCASFEKLPQGATIQFYPYRKFPVQQIGKNCFERDAEGY